uniref:Uncharacterized protein n=1 Tax=Rhizophora mucronata TaxID=61149 RepID=A0A2P2NUW8_RHIMU
MWHYVPFESIMWKNLYMLDNAH